MRNFGGDFLGYLPVFAKFVDVSPHIFFGDKGPLEKFDLGFCCELPPR